MSDQVTGYVARTSENASSGYKYIIEDSQNGGVFYCSHDVQV